MATFNLLYKNFSQAHFIAYFKLKAGRSVGHTHTREMLVEINEGMSQLIIRQTSACDVATE